MACTAHKTLLLRTVAARGYAAQAGAKIVSEKNLEIETRTLPNKLVVASAESNSLCAKHNIGKISSETLQHYIAINYKANRAAVVGVGVDRQLLVGYAKNLALDSGTGTETPSKYYGGVDKAGNWAHVAIGTQGAGGAHPKKALAFALLQQVVGAGPATKRGNCGGALVKVVGAALGEKLFGFSANYSERRNFSNQTSSDHFHELYERIIDLKSKIIIEKERQIDLFSKLIAHYEKSIEEIKNRQETLESEILLANQRLNCRSVFEVYESTKVKGIGTRLERWRNHAKANSTLLEDLRKATKKPDLTQDDVGEIAKELYSSLLQMTHQFPGIRVVMLHCDKFSNEQCYHLMVLVCQALHVDYMAFKQNDDWVYELTSSNIKRIAIK